MRRPNAVVAHVRPRKVTKRRCGRCGVRAPGYDQGEGRRRWRCLDLGVVMCFLEADSPRVSCPTHGPTVAQVPWARHGAGHTRDFDDAARLARHPHREVDGVRAHARRLADGGLGRRPRRPGRAAPPMTPSTGSRVSGSTRSATRRGHRYLTVVVDHDSGRLVWAAVGRDKKTLNGFFDLLGSERCAKITLVSADGAEWIGDVVAERAKNATLCIDSFHVVQWATDALDKVRRESGTSARRSGITGHAAELKGCRYALWKNPEDLTARQEAKLAFIAKVNTRLYRAYLMKEQLRIAIRTKGVLSLTMLEAWLAWAAALSHPCLRRARSQDPSTTSGHRGGDDKQLEQRLDRVDEHQAAGAAPDGLRFQGARAPDRPRPPRPGWLLPGTSRAGLRIRRDHLSAISVACADGSPRSDGGGYLAVWPYPTASWTRWLTVNDRRRDHARHVTAR